jgi:catechol 2,3-dioxygenase-like lactoylglutathione lyase family enzyme
MTAPAATAVAAVVAQLRTTDLDGSIAFYTQRLGFDLLFRHADFYAGLAIDGHEVHLKRVDDPDPSIVPVQRGGHLHLYLRVADVDAFAAAVTGRGVVLRRPVHDTAWGTRECVLHDDQGHVIHVGQVRPGGS